MSIMLNTFTDGARKAVSNAVKEAKRLNHDCIGTEHILLGLARDESSFGGSYLFDRGVTRERLILVVERLSPKGSRSVLSQLPLDFNARELLENAESTSRDLGCNYVGTEHLLYAIMDSKSIGYNALVELDFKPTEVKEVFLSHIRKIYSEYSEKL